MADRIEDLRDWWDRTRRRRLKPQVRAAVGRVRPAGAAPSQGSSGTAAGGAAASTEEPAGVARVAPLEPSRETAVAAEAMAVPTGAQAGGLDVAAGAEAAEAEPEAEPDPEAAADEDAQGPGGEPGLAVVAEAAHDAAHDEAAPEAAQATEPWSTTPATEPDGTSADPFAPDWIADVVEEAAIDGEGGPGVAATADGGTDWMITDPAAAGERPGVPWPAAAAGVVGTGWGEDEGVAAIEPDLTAADEPDDEPEPPEAWMSVPVAPVDREHTVADWSEGAVGAVAVAGPGAPEDEADLATVDLADLPAMPSEDDASLARLVGTMPALQWAAPGAAPWETPVAEAAAAEVSEMAPEPGPEPEIEAQPAVDAWIEVAPEAAPEAEPVLEPEPAPEPEPEPGDGQAAGLDPWLLAQAKPAAVEEPVAEPDAAPPSDPWAGVTWSAAERPAPWSPGSPAPGEDPLDLDEEQRRWLGRDVRSVEGIGPGYGAQLEAVGIASLEDLLFRGATRRGRQEIADSTGISGKLILRWVNNADLFRIRGVGTQYADLLEAAGVDTVVELALRRPDNLAARLATTNEIRRLVRQVPTQAQVADWVRQARELPRIVAY